MDIEEIALYDRRESNSLKWDGLKDCFGDSELLPLWVADMDFRAPAPVREVLKAAAERGDFGYFTVPDSYWQALMDWEKQRHCYAVKKEWLRSSDGVVSSIYRLIRIFTAPGDDVMTLVPVYHPFIGSIHDTGRTAVLSHLQEEDGVYTIDFDDVEAKLKAHRVKLFLLCSPHNPVGRVWRKEELGRLLKLCKAYHVLVISDEIHQDIIGPGRTHLPAATVADSGHFVITLTAPTKTFNLAGLKNSFLIIENQDLRCAYDEAVAKTGGDHLNSFGYLAATAAYCEGVPWLAAVKTVIWENYALLKTALTPFPEITISPLEGTYLAWLDLSKVIDKAELRDFIQNQCGLAVNYGGNFLPEKTADGHIRLNLATPAATMEKAMDALVAGFAKKEPLKRSSYKYGGIRILGHESRTKESEQ